VANAQPIFYDGKLAAMTIGGYAIIADRLTGEERLTVEAMCLYALEVQAGERPGPYSQECALAYARRARLHRARLRLHASRRRRSRTVVGWPAGRRGSSGRPRIDHTHLTMAIIHPEHDHYPTDPSRCFLCSELFDDGLPVVYWTGADNEIFLHGECAGSFVLRLARDAWEIDRYLGHARFPPASDADGLPPGWLE
jgi:hypothetical protein